VQKWGKLGNLLVDMLVACLLVAACIYFSVYMALYAGAFNARAHYRVYDDVQRARARWLLPLKVDPAGVAPAQLTTLQVCDHKGESRLGCVAGKVKGR
jgi:hypothetical protein